MEIGKKIEEFAQKYGIDISKLSSADLSKLKGKFKASQASADTTLPKGSTNSEFTVTEESLYNSSDVDVDDDKFWDYLKNKLFPSTKDAVSEEQSVSDADKTSEETEEEQSSGVKVSDLTGKSKDEFKQIAKQNEELWSVIEDLGFDNVFDMIDEDGDGIVSEEELNKIAELSGSENKDEITSEGILKKMIEGLQSENEALKSEVAAAGTGSAAGSAGSGAASGGGSSLGTESSADLESMSLDELKEEKANRKEQMEKAKEALDKLIEEDGAVPEELKTQKEEIEAAIEQNQAQINETKANLESKKSAKSSKESSKSSAQGELSSLQASLASLPAPGDDEEANAQIAEQKAQIEEQISQKQEEIAQLEEEISALDNEIAALEEKLAALEAEKENLQAQRDENAQAIYDASSDKSALEEAISNYNSAAAEYAEVDMAIEEKEKAEKEEN